MLESFVRSDRDLGRKPFSIAEDGRTNNRRKARIDERLAAYDHKSAVLPRIPTRFEHTKDFATPHERLSREELTLLAPGIQVFRKLRSLNGLQRR